MSFVVNAMHGTWFGPVSHYIQLLAYPRSFHELYLSTDVPTLLRCGDGSE